MFPKYHFARRIILIVPLVFFIMSINAQDKDQTDTTRVLSEDMETMTDTVDGPTGDETDIEEGYQDTPGTSKSIYFLDKELQVGGGGPDSLEIRKLPDSVVSRLQTADDFWYVNYVFQKEKEKEVKEKVSFTQTQLFQTILWLVIIGGFAAFVVIYLANSNVGLFRKAGKPLVPGEEADLETDNIFEINYRKEIDKAISNGNYRFAIRLMFLRSLKDLSDKKVIQYKQDRTNFDYLLQLHSTKYYTDFFRLTRSYEYSWYGQFAIEPEKFTIIKNDFESFDQKLNYR